MMPVATTRKTGGHQHFPRAIQDNQHTGNQEPQHCRGCGPPCGDVQPCQASNERPGRGRIEDVPPAEGQRIFGNAGHHARQGHACHVSDSEGRPEQEVEQQSRNQG